MMIQRRVKSCLPFSSSKKIVNDVVVAGVTGVVFAGIAYGLSKAFAALKLKIINKGGGNTKYDNIEFDSLSSNDLSKVTTDIRTNGGSPIEIPGNATAIAQSKMDISR